MSVSLPSQRRDEPRKRKNDHGANRSRALPALSRTSRAAAAVGAPDTTRSALPGTRKSCRLPRSVSSSSTSPARPPRFVAACSTRPDWGGGRGRVRSAQSSSPVRSGGVCWIRHNTPSPPEYGLTALQLPERNIGRVHVPRRLGAGSMFRQTDPTQRRDDQARTCNRSDRHPRGWPGLAPDPRPVV